MSQSVILIHGAPACGKLSTARRLAEIRDLVILHNHLTFNLARTFFPIGDERLNALHRELRLVTLKHTLAADLPVIVLTLVYSEPESVAHVAAIRQLCAGYGAALKPVYLRCPKDVLLARVREPAREADGKLRSPERLAALLAEHRYGPIPDADTLILDNGKRTAGEVAALIAARLLPDGPIPPPS
jgi:hypothetical protein